MKKLFSAALIILVALALTGCTTTDTTDLEADLQAKIDLIAVYESQLIEYQEDLLLLNETLAIRDADILIAEDDKSDLSETIESLQQDLEYLQSLIYENVITITLDDGYGAFVSRTVGFNDDFEGTLFDLLEGEFSVGYTESEYGIFLNSVDVLDTVYGNYISLSKNGIASLVGIEDITITDNDVISLDIIWWDTLQQNVYEAIKLFVDEQASNYVNEIDLDYNVMIALNQLDLIDIYTNGDTHLLIDESALVSSNDYVKAAYKLNNISVTNSSVLTSLDDVLPSVSSYSYALTLNALNAFDNTGSNFTTFETTVLDYYKLTETPFDLGADAGGMALTTLSYYSDQTEIQALIDEYAQWISDDQLPSGGFLTRDMTWGETTYPGTENAATMSQIILGLLANGFDPSGIDYTQGENNLISRILEFQNEDGSFDYLYGDELADEDFSTPQAFLALVMYHAYVNNNFEAINAYNR